MTSLQISISPSKRAAGRFVSRVRRAIQKAMAEENDKRGLTQSDVARALGVHRSVISREINGFADLTLSRAAELAWALGRKPSFDLLEPVAIQNTNLPPVAPAVVMMTSNSGRARVVDDEPGRPITRARAA